MIKLIISILVFMLLYGSAYGNKPIQKNNVKIIINYDKENPFIKHKTASRNVKSTSRRERARSFMSGFAAGGFVVSFGFGLTFILINKR